MNNCTYKFENNEPYILSFVDNKINMKYLFLDSINNAFTIEHCIAIYNIEQDNSDCCKLTQFLKNKVQVIQRKNLNLLRDSLVSSNEKYSLLLFNKDAVILKNLDNTFISVFKQFNTEFVCSGAKYDINNLNISLYSAKNRHLSGDIIFGLTTELVKLINFLISEISKQYSSEFIPTAHLISAYVQIYIRDVLKKQIADYVDNNCRLFCSSFNDSFKIEQVGKNQRNIVEKSDSFFSLI